VGIERGGLVSPTPPSAVGMLTIVLPGAVDGFPQIVKLPNNSKKPLPKLSGLKNNPTLSQRKW